MIQWACLTYLLLLVNNVHNRGSCAGRDIHLENFSVSNGGKDLIEDASVIMAYGRRYGLIGRNGTGK
jgi:ATP-binding cassette subfamily F protein 3